MEQLVGMTLSTFVLVNGASHHNVGVWELDKHLLSITGRGPQA